MHSMSSAASAAALDTLPEKRGLRSALYLIPSSLTLGSVLCGWYSMVCSIRGGLYLADRLRAAELFSRAVTAIGLAIILDNLDGRIARTIGATSEFGIELDSLADVLTFGGAAAILAYMGGYGSAAGLEVPGFIISFLFIAAGAIRLARSNVRVHSTQPDKELAAHEEYFFVGLPIPAAAGVVAATAHFYYSQAAGAVQGAVGPDLRAYSLVLLGVVPLLALLMVSTFHYSKLKFAPRNRRRVSVFNRLTFPALAAAVALGVWLNSRWVVLTIAILYAVHGPIVWTARSFKRMQP